MREFIFFIFLLFFSSHFSSSAIFFVLNQWFRLCSFLYGGYWKHTFISSKSVDAFTYRKQCVFNITSQSLGLVRLPASEWHTDPLTTVCWPTANAAFSVLQLMGRSSACFQWLWFFFFLIGSIRKLLVPVVALVKVAGGVEVCSLASDQDREDVIDHFTQAAKAEEDTQTSGHRTSSFLKSHSWALR